MGSQDDRIARYRAELEAAEAELQREKAEQEAVDSGAEATAAGERGSRRLRDLGFLVGVLTLSLLLVGVSMTLTGMAGHDIGDARRTGSATVTSCERRGPVTNRGFGFHERCAVTIRWDDGTATRLVDDGTFRSADIAHEVRVGYLGTRKYALELAREDTPYRPWFTWVGVLAGLIAAVPGILAVMMLHAYVRAALRGRRSAG
ncbi:DUF6346 domain-containing protein [Actinoplanes sp. NPDC026670]|uniref:DUF6346 domain-containing protein n=1 Tax=Actinoplanes sp. NPDC026670 TaxID=3154700 RepID=UPI0033E5BF4B